MFSLYMLIIFYTSMDQGESDAPAGSVAGSLQVLFRSPLEYHFYNITNHAWDLDLNEEPILILRLLVIAQ